ncbi:hypothetical protein [Bosea sp. (in: a-proteobacteria)]|uniref:hypothetical protein n=1 Tax=Bosea sp. (in: a-proteobacteria) TaxID=1871050 RepID=UPI00273614EC|nr:hypothetical protein [Bosea sp. (in: a-proteobacteria)]MDP3410124.1 hypothetical protein [Bosea sp. (in: a-proteobacteria)]
MFFFSVEIPIPAALFDSPDLRLSSLSLGGSPLWQLPRGDVATALRYLSVISNTLNPHVRPFLARARRLTFLTLCGPSTQDFDVFTAAASFPELTHLELQEEHAIDSLLAQLASAPLLAQLESLSVAGRVSDSTLQAVLRSAERFRHLKTFRIDSGASRSRTNAELRRSLVALLPSLSISLW